MTREQSLKRDIKATETVMRKGMEAFYEGKPQIANPYPSIHRGENMACGGRWWRHWNDGWLEAKQQYEQEQLTRVPQPTRDRT